MTAKTLARKRQQGRSLPPADRDHWAIVKDGLCSVPKGRTVWKYIIPRIALTDVPVMMLIALRGGVIAGLYGIVHDQITYSISPEYFTRLKFEQFRYADFGLGDRVFASTIGFLATWWIGFMVAWFLARRLVADQPRDQALRQVRKGVMCIVAFSLVFGFAGSGYGLWRGPNADYSSWTWAFRELSVTEPWSFVRVAYIHNAGYLGGFIGLIVALAVIRPTAAQSTTGKSTSFIGAPLQ